MTIRHATPVCLARMATCVSRAQRLHVLNPAKPAFVTSSDSPATTKIQTSWAQVCAQVAGATRARKVIEAVRASAALERAVRLCREAGAEERRKLSAKRRRKYLRNRGSVDTARRRANLLKATPPWVDHAEIRKIYAQAAKLGMHVDHIHPLKGKNFCGLHVPWNLQLLTPGENFRKGNRLTSDCLLTQPSHATYNTTATCGGDLR